LSSIQNSSSERFSTVTEKLATNRTSALRLKFLALGSIYNKKEREEEKKKCSQIIFHDPT
jgi:hypothetical protein